MLDPPALESEPLEARLAMDDLMDDIWSIVAPLTKKTRCPNCFGKLRPLLSLNPRTSTRTSYQGRPTVRFESDFSTSDCTRSQFKAAIRRAIKRRIKEAIQCHS